MSGKRRAEKKTVTVPIAIDEHRKRVQAAVRELRIAIAEAEGVEIPVRFFIRSLDQKGSRVSFPPWFLSTNFAWLGAEKGFGIAVNLN